MQINCKIKDGLCAQLWPTLCNPIDCKAMDCEAPLSMEFSRWNTGVGCHALLQGIFLTPEWNWRVSCFLHWQGGLSHYPHLGSPKGGLHLSKRFSISLIVMKNCWKFILQNHTFILNTMLNHRKRQKLNEKCKLL